MDIEFHYYITYLIAKKAGFNPKESETIAYASQYVDDNTIIFNINEESAYYYENYISQTINILKAKKKLMRIYPIFHFIPGDYDSPQAKRRDGRMHLLNCTPDSKNANYIFKNALKSKNLYQIGIATHSFVDTWAHQNFVGYYDDFNSIKGVLESALPNIGHADAMHQPDMAGLIWKDKRLLKANQKIDNKERFISASKRLLEELCFVVDGNIKETEIIKRQNELEKDIDFIIQENDPTNKRKKTRIKRCIELSTKEQYGASELKKYKKYDWFKKAVFIDKRGLDDLEASIFGEFTILKDKYTWKDTNNYQQSDWYKFQEEIKKYQEFSYGYLTDKVFSQMDLEAL
jgi:hypothetical protein